MQHDSKKCQPARFLGKKNTWEQTPVGDRFSTRSDTPSKIELVLTVIGYNIEEVCKLSFSLWHY